MLVINPESRLLGDHRETISTPRKDDDKDSIREQIVGTARHEHSDTREQRSPVLPSPVELSPLQFFAAGPEGNLAQILTQRCRTPVHHGKHYVCKRCHCSDKWEQMQRETGDEERAKREEGSQPDGKTRVRQARPARKEQAAPTPVPAMVDEANAAGNGTEMNGHISTKNHVFHLEKGRHAVAACRRHSDSRKCVVKFVKHERERTIEAVHVALIPRVV